MLFHATPPLADNSIDFRSYIDDFNIGQFIYKDKFEQYTKLLADDRVFLADVAAAVFAAVSRSGYVHKDIYQRLVECCRDIIIAQGFSEGDDDDIRAQLRPTAENGSSNNVLVAGCQNPQMLLRRVEKAGEFVSTLGYNCNVIFSGKNPDPSGKSSVQILDESKRMRIEFRRCLLEKGTPLPRMHDIVGEGGSTTTKTNIAELFSGNYLSQTKHNNLIVISSTFHLIRLGREIRNLLSRSEFADKISELVLVGAEEPKHQFFVQDAPYIKLMIFDVFDYLLRIGNPRLTNGVR